ncbi:MAG: guanylate kinase [Firmicutes bacterium]|nr:guanylate kinase [Bacillota bacterium]
MRQGKLFVISGPSGAGKGTICNELIKTGNFALSVSMTTRAPRTGEIPGKSYFFVTEEEFVRTIEEGGFLEHAQIYGNRYGTPKGPVLRQLAEGKDVILEIEMQGALSVKRSYPDAVLIFILPPSLAVLRQRLAGRGTETEEEIEKRSSQCLSEIRMINDYDYYVINDVLSDAVADALAIVRAEQLSTGAGCGELIRKYEEE